MNKFLNPQTFFCHCSLLYKEKMLTDKIEVEIEDGREAFKNPSSSKHLGCLVWVKCLSYLYIVQGDS